MAADTNTVDILIMDGEYYTKAFSISTKVDIGLALGRYREYMCPHCTKPDSFEFWYKDQKGHETVKSLGMRNGDIINVQTTSSSARPPCPLAPRGGASSNIHYRNQPSVAEILSYTPSPEVEAISIRLWDLVDEMTVKTGPDATLAHVMNAFPSLKKRQANELCFVFKGLSVQAWERPSNLQIRDGDAIEVLSEQTA